MNIEKFTTKFQQALSEAQSLALGKDNQFIEPVHLLTALLNQQDGSIAPILTTSGVNVALLRNELNAELNKLPQVSGKVHNFSSLFLCILYSTLVLYFCENRKICTITYQITPQTPSG